MTTALSERPPAREVAVTSDQIDLIRRTIADGATPDELKLYLFDCARQGVHPLDKLIHFTKRSGKYTPVTSIDFMRIRAAETNEYAGSDDAVFAGEGTAISAATVTVWRLVQGTRCSFTATARWREYKPETHDFMWRKMPHTMLAKCAEALALRKGFPRQLAGLYAAEELDQAANSAAAAGPAPVRGELAPDPDPAPPATGIAKLIDDQALVFVERVDATSTKKPGVTRYTITLSSGEVATTINDWQASMAKDAKEKRTLVRPELKETRYGTELVKLSPAIEPVRSPEPMPTDAEIPF